MQIRIARLSSLKDRNRRTEKKRLAKKLRANLTPAESALKVAIRKAFPRIVKCKSQFLICGYIADFYFPDFKAVIEVDGTYHNAPAQRKADRERELNLLKHGIRTLRFSNEAVLQNPTEVANSILSNILNR